MVVFYHIDLGSYVGCCTTKGCRYFDKDVLSEDTAFDMTLLRECSSLLMAGAVPFSMYAASYNRQFGYIEEVLPDHSKGKRMKR